MGLGDRDDRPADRDGGPVAVPVPPESVPVSIMDFSAAALRSEIARPFALESEPPLRAMIMRISASTFCIVTSETFLCVVIERPRNTSPSFSA